MEFQSSVHLNVTKSQPFIPQLATLLGKWSVTNQVLMIKERELSLCRPKTTGNKTPVDAIKPYSSGRKAKIVIVPGKRFESYILKLQDIARLWSGF